MRIIGVDPSLTCTGVAAIGRPGAGVHDTWSVRSLGQDAPTYEDRADRLTHLQRGFVDVLDDFCEDWPSGPLLLVIESRDFQTPGKAGHATDRAGLSWLFVVAARAYGARIAAVAPSQLKVYATGRGNADKPEIRPEVEERYGFYVRNDDEADAVTLAAMGAHAMGAPLVDVPPSHARALTAVAWPRMI